MIRYGPGGITAVDYDNDGFYDLFIPDGVESRLFRNRARRQLSRTSPRRPGSPASTASASGSSPTTTTTATRTSSSAGPSSPTSSSTTTATARSRDVTSAVGHRRRLLHDGRRPGATTTTTASSTSTSGAISIRARTIPTTFYARNGEPNQLYRNNGDGTLHQRHRAGRRGRDRALPRHGLRRLRRRRRISTSTSSTTSAARRSTTTTATARSPTSPSRRGTLAYGAGMSASFGDYDNDGRPRHLRHATSAPSTPGSPSRRRSGATC